MRAAADPWLLLHNFVRPILEETALATRPQLLYKHCTLSKAPLPSILTHWLAVQPTCAPLQVFEWLTWAASELALVSDEKLQHINSHLATRMFLAGNILSLADLVVFGILHPAVVSSG